MVTPPFAPVVDENCRTLILGSFPSVKSRENGFYYGHPQNRFWRMLAAVYADAVPVSITEKTSLLLRHHLGAVGCNRELRNRRFGGCIRARGGAGGHCADYRPGAHHARPVQR